MNKELQDRAWRSLPKEFREELKKRPRYHTLTGYTEADLLYELFGRDKFLPDAMVISGAKVDGNGVTLPPDCKLDVKPTPKFKVGDKVTMTNEAKISYNGVGTIIEVSNNHEYAFYRIKECPVLFAEQYLEPYTEPEPQQTEENMEEKELNLADLLRKYNADKIYLVDEGEVELVEIIDNFTVDVKGVDGRPIGLRGETLEIKPTGFAYIYPSKEAFLAHPLESAKAWQIWAEERKPKVAQVQIRLISNDGRTVEDFENIEVWVSNFDMSKAAEAVKRTLEQFHAKNAEK